MSQFYFVLTNPEAMPLLELEMHLRFPELRKSYSKPGFLTLKGEKSIPFKAHFGRLSGICLGKFNLPDLKFPKAWVWKREEDLIIPPELQKLSDESMFKIGEKVTLIMMINQDEYWVGEYELLRTHFQTPGEVSSIIEREVPSRAYYKIAELYEAFDLPFDHQERVLELGSAPGGASLFLLEQDLNVLGVDPAEMHPTITKNFYFRHIKVPFETLREDDFREGVDWIISDINLPPHVVLREVHRLETFLEPKGVILTLKIGEEKYLKSLPFYMEDFRKKGFKVDLKYVPSYRQEIALIALRS